MLDYASPALARKAPRWLMWYLWVLPGIMGLVHVGLMIQFLTRDEIILAILGCGLVASPFVMAMGIALWCVKCTNWPKFNSIFSAVLFTIVCIGGLPLIVYWMYFAPKDPLNGLIFLMVLGGQWLLLVVSIVVLNLACAWNDKNLRNMV